MACKQSQQSRKWTSEFHVLSKFYKNFRPLKSRHNYSLYTILQNKRQRWSHSPLQFSPPIITFDRVYEIQSIRLGEGMITSINFISSFKRYVNCVSLCKLCVIINPIYSPTCFFLAVLKRFTVGWWNFLTFSIIILSTIWNSLQWTVIKVVAMATLLLRVVH